MVEVQSWTPLEKNIMWQHFWPPRSVLSPNKPLWGGGGPLNAGRPPSGGGSPSGKIPLGGGGNGFPIQSAKVPFGVA
jgi:hypothetical protein